MKLTVVTPSYNQGRFLSEAIRSVARQECDCGVEHIVIDGGSSDETLDVLRAHSAVLSSWISEPDDGQTHALQKGFSRATGEIVGWINSDDYYFPGAFQRVASRFRQGDAPDVVVGFGVIVDEAGNAIRECRHAITEPSLIAALGFDFTQQSVFFRRSALQSVLPLDTRREFCMDLDLLIRLALSGARFALVPAFLGAFRWHGAAKSTLIAPVGDRERSELLAQMRNELRRRNVHIPPRVVASALRRFRLLRQGSVKYAMLGGRLGISSEALHVVAAAKAWQ